MMFLQFVYPTLEIGKEIAVSGKDDFDGQVSDLVQTFQIVFK